MNFQIAKQGRRVDIMHYHHAWNGFYSGTWDQAKAQYSKIMSDKEEVNYVTVLREPVAHYLSYYYYFLNPINKVKACVVHGVLFQSGSCALFQWLLCCSLDRTLCIETAAKKHKRRMAAEHSPTKSAHHCFKPSLSR